MKSIVSLQKKLIIFFVLVALVLAGAGYFYLNAMKTTEGNLNITKIKKVNKLYSYDVYSDFYFRIIKYDENGENVAEYSELQPIKTSIGYNLEKNNSKPILQSTLDKKTCLSENNANDLKKYTRMMREFEETFGKIVATQDKEYFESSYKSTQEILKSLYNIELKTQSSVDEYYNEIKDLPIANMRMKYYKLDKIPKNQREEVKVAPNKKGEWQPNIVEWNFGEHDKIYLRYLMKWENSDLEDFINKTAKNKTVIKLVKMNSNKLQTMYFMKYNNQNKLDTLFMDANGYVYILTFEATNPASFEKYISDYLKIVYGIYFEDIQNFENWFANEQMKKTEFSNAYVSFGVNFFDDSELDMGSLGFDCDNENEIILKIGKYTYHFDENEKNCTSYRDKVMKCTGCHGSKFESKALGVSKIVKDMSEEDIIKSIKGYKDGNLNVAGFGALMKGQVAMLSDEDIENVALIIKEIKIDETMLTWDKSNKTYFIKQPYPVYVIEEDLTENDEYDGKSIVFTAEDIYNINNGIAVKKDIGSYFIMFQK
jgi:cytochrome c553